MGSTRRMRRGGRSLGSGAAARSSVSMVMGTFYRALIRGAKKHRREEGARAGVLRRRSSLWSGHHLDTRHHAPVLVPEDVAVIDELAELRELDVEHLRIRR